MNDGFVLYQAYDLGKYRMVGRYQTWLEAEKERTAREEWELLNVPRYRRLDYRVIGAESWRRHFQREADSE